MVDIKKVIVFNIRKRLAEVNKTEKDLARYLSISEKKCLKRLIVLRCQISKNCS